MNVELAWDAACHEFNIQNSTLTIQHSPLTRPPRAGLRYRSCHGPRRYRRLNLRLFATARPRYSQIGSGWTRQNAWLPCAKMISQLSETRLAGFIRDHSGASFVSAVATIRRPLSSGTNFCIASIARVTNFSQRRCTQTLELRSDIPVTFRRQRNERCSPLAPSNGGGWRLR